MQISFIAVHSVIVFEFQSENKARESVIALLTKEIKLLYEDNDDDYAMNIALKKLCELKHKDKGHQLISNTVELHTSAYHNITSLRLYYHLLLSS